MLSEMLTVDLWPTVLRVIKTIIYYEKGGKQELKRGISVLLRVNIKLACDCRFPFYMLYRPEVEAEAKEIVIQKLRTFYSEFEKIKSVTFGSIGVINLARTEANRAAEVLPSNETVEKIISCCLQSINKVSTKCFL